jgi:hypothetical protein
MGRRSRLWWAMAKGQCNQIFIGHIFCVLEPEGAELEDI